MLIGTLNQRTFISTYSAKELVNDIYLAEILKQWSIILPQVGKYVCQKICQLHLRQTYYFHFGITNSKIKRRILAVKTNLVKRVIFCQIIVIAVILILVYNWR